MSSMAKPNGAMPVEDPFTTSTEPETHNPRQRYSGFGAHSNQNLAISSSTASPRQLKRALEAHIVETERRLKEASHVGTVLLKQRQELNDRLKEVETGDKDDQGIGPDLQRRLTELEREFAETSRETAKIFVPKSRVPSGESESSDPSVFSSQTSQSPSKVQPPSRKLRNQPQSRINDVKLAAEISESLLAQVRQLQAACSEKEEMLKRANLDRDQLELEIDAARAKIRTMDQEEQRYKEENWALETQVQDLSSASRATAERERRLNASLAAAKQEKSTLERNHEELRAAHGKLTEDHATAKKHHDAELGSIRRDLSSGEAEAATLKKKVDDLTSQNKELAMAMAARLQAERAAANAGMDMDGMGGASDEEEGGTPEASPPPSPSKATPRHGGLESETLKSSLHHAQRMIQHLKNNIHREKTEKFELRRLLQEARDDLDESKKKGSVDSKRGKGKEAVKKPVARPDKLGAARSPKDEIVMEDDPEWEDHEQDELMVQPTPSKSQLRAVPQRAVSRRSYTDQSTDPDAYITATENSDAFETANESASHADNETETEAFQTTVETLDGSDGDVTETEASSRRGVSKRPSMGHVRGFSMQSTASTSDDEEPNTPNQSVHLHGNRSGVGSAHFKSNNASKNQLGPAFGSESMHSTPTITQDSPASIASGASGTPSSMIMPGRSLFAELDGLSDGESEQSASISGTPASMGKRSVMETPDKSIAGSLPGSATGIGSAFRKTTGPSRLRSMQSAADIKNRMVDAGTMTEPEPQPEPVKAPVMVASDAGTMTESEAETPQVPVIIASDAGTMTESDPDLTRDYVMLTGSNNSSVVSLPREAIPPLAQEPVVLGKSTVFSTATEPVAEPPVPVIAPEPIKLVRSNISSTETIPTPSPPPQPISKFKLNRSANGSTKMKDMGTDAESSSEDASQPKTSQLFGSMLRKRLADRERSNEPIVVAEDPVSDADLQSFANRDREITPVGTDGRVPFKPVNGNVIKTPPVTANGTAPEAANATKTVATAIATQTMLSARDIDSLFDTSRSIQQARDTYKDASVAAVPTSPKRPKDPLQPRRPGSSGSIRSGFSPPPPLPAEAKEVIAAATAASAGGVDVTKQRASMGPPIMPASAYKQINAIRKPKTPVGSITSVQLHSPKHAHRGSVAGRSGLSSPITRRSSVSSFASEIDARFGLPGQPSAQAFGGPATDPRVIQAITQTMIGEALWKYTRTLGSLSNSNRHKRFVWVHPYTRTLYWSDSDPTSIAKRSELRAKSAPIEAVEVVVDPNPHPSGLADRSILVTTVGRQLKFTASSRERHEMWAAALSYLLLKTEDEDVQARSDEHNRKKNLTEDEVDHFIAPPPPEGIRSESRTARSRFSTASLASRYTSTMSRYNNDDTIRAKSIRRSQSVQPNQSHQSFGSRLSMVFKTPSSIRGSVSSRYDLRDEQANEEDLDATPRATDRHSHYQTDGGIENIRACCDGKHDVGSVSRNRHHHQTSVHSISNTINSLAGTAASRTGKRTSLAPSVTTNRSTTHSRRQSEDESRRRSQSVRRGNANGLMEMDPANIVG